MRRKIMGVTVGTPTSPKKIKDEIKPVQTVNGVEPDENGNVEISVSGGGGGGGIAQETDPTVPDWAKQPNPPAESDPTVPAWAKQDKKPAYGWDEITGKPFTNGKLNTECLPDGIGGGSENAVEYIEQTLTEEQKAQARTNISAAPAEHTHNFAPTYTYGTEDLEAGVSPLPEGTLYFVCK